MRPGWIHRISRYYRNRFGERVWKLPLDASFTCPTRDGTLARRGCLYCDAWGSGTGMGAKDLRTQIHTWKTHYARRGIRKFFAYFQAYTHTWGDPERLEELLRILQDDPDMVGFSVSSRPDTLSDAHLQVLSRFRDRMDVWLDMGLESANPATLRRVVRGHGVAAFVDAVLRAHAHGIKICAHLILGLPGDTPADWREGVHLLAVLQVEGVKFHPLYIPRTAPIRELYERGKIRLLTRRTYTRAVAQLLEELPASTVVHRLTGETHPEELVAPAWVLEKTRVIQEIEQILRERGSWQGKRAFSGARGQPSV